ncbi:ribbon-helix-helix domain-containing protein [Peribacillus butanolivorans]|uniref:ribbon-helix-helix domain-containing protein n=1 Tax=Peribacillus butanolivorans TaxID=421767 RepID=UPI002E236593|nr:ribbon-helix-helix domain-containing protein [Peribacillus butanolivorans]
MATIKKQINLRLHDHVLEALDEIAKESNLSKNELITRAIENQYKLKKKKTV